MSPRPPSLPPLLLLLAGPACSGGDAGDAASPPEVVILLSCDTLRADRLGAYGSDRGLTPNLDALAAESVVFTEAYAPAPFTLPSVGALLTGRYPHETSIQFNETVIPGAVPTLASFLAARDFENGAVVSNFVLRRNTGLEQGFGQRYDDRMDAKEVFRSNAPERRAASTTAAALGMLDDLVATGSDRLFLWVHYQDPHGPYTPPDDLLQRYVDRELARPGGDRELPLPPEGDQKAHTGIGWLPNYQKLGDERRVGFYVAAYDAEVRFMDDELGRLLDGLRARDLYDDSLIVFTADHGEGMGERDYWFAHGEHLTDGCVRVPLLFRSPGLAPGRRDDPACLVDVVPTVLNLVGSRSPSHLLGRDLFAEDAAPREIFMATLASGYTPKLGFIADGWKIVCDIDPETQQSTEYTLQKLGGDGTNVAPGNRDTSVELTTRMNAFIAKLRARKQAVDAQRTEADLRRQKRLVEEVQDIVGFGDDESREEALRALGYVGSDGED